MTDKSFIVNLVTGKDTLSPKFKQIEEELNAIDTLQKKIGQAGTLMGKGFKLDDSVKNLKDLSNAAGIADKSFESFLEDGKKRAKQFDMSMLTLLFTGMALQRTFGGALRGITTSFLRAEDNTSGLGKATTRLGAAWEFFKFSLFDALNTDFFINVIDGIINLGEAFNELPDGVKLTVLGITAALAALGTGAVIYAQIKLAWGAIFGSSGTIVESLTKSRESIDAFLSSKGLGDLRQIGNIAIGIKTVFDISDLATGKATLDNTLKDIAVNLGAIALFNPATRAWTIPLAIVLTLAPIGKEIQEFGEKWRKSFADVNESGNVVIKPFNIIKGGLGGLIEGFGQLLTPLDNAIEEFDNSRLSVEGVNTQINKTPDLLNNLITPLAETNTSLNNVSISTDDFNKTLETNQTVMTNTQPILNTTKIYFDDITTSINNATKANDAFNACMSKTPSSKNIFSKIGGAISSTLNFVSKSSITKEQ
jgi:hypothetical protein